MVQIIIEVSLFSIIGAVISCVSMACNVSVRIPSRLTDECAHCTPELFLRKLPVLFRTRLDNIDILRLTISDSIRQL